MTRSDKIWSNKSPFQPFFKNCVTKPSKRPYQKGLQNVTPDKHSNTFCTPPLWASSCSGPPYTVFGDAGKHAGTGAYCALRTERRG